jgi:hypothetical protein
MPGRRQGDQRTSEALVRVMDAIDAGEPYPEFGEDLDAMGARVNNLWPRIRQVLRSPAAATRMPAGNPAAWEQELKKFTLAQIPMVLADVGDPGTSSQLVDLGIHDIVVEYVNLKEWGWKGLEFKSKHSLYFLLH